MNGKNQKNSAENNKENKVSNGSENLSPVVQGAHPHDMQQTLPFPLGYSHKQRCRLSHFYNDGESIRCLVHNADGVVEGKITRPDIHCENLEEWGLYKVNLVLLKNAETYQAEILNLNPCFFFEAELEYVPRVLCPVPAKLDELRHLVQLIQRPSLRCLVSAIFGKPQNYERLLTAYGSRYSYTYPGGLLTRIVAAGKQAIRMGFQTQIEADVVLTCALLYDIGRAFNANLMSEDNRMLLGFVPHKKTIEIVEGELDFNDPTEESIKQILLIGYSEQYPSLHPSLKQHAALAKIDTLIRIAPTKSDNGSRP